MKTKATPDEALRAFYRECESALVDPVLADRVRERMKTLIDSARTTMGVSSGASPSEPVSMVLRGQVTPPVRLEKPTQTPDELVELAINRVVEACRSYWAEAKAKGTPIT
jgi:hypothetical protein